VVVVRGWSSPKGASKPVFVVFSSGSSVKKFITQHQPSFRALEKMGKKNKIPCRFCMLTFLDRDSEREALNIDPVRFRTGYTEFQSPC
jgi:hypothetical protein